MSENYSMKKIKFDKSLIRKQDQFFGFLWRIKNEKSLARELRINGKLDPIKLFEIKEAQSYVKLKEGDFKREGILIGGEEFAKETIENENKSTGYLKPWFRFSLNEMRVDDYVNLLEALNLKEKTKVSSSKIPQIESLHNLFNSQYERHTSEIVQFNTSIAEEMASLYSEAEKSILRKHDLSQKDFQKRLPEELNKLILHMRTFFNRVQNGAAPKELNGTKPFEILYINNYVSEEKAGQFSDRIFALLENRQTFMTTFRMLTRKILAIESIINDVVYFRELKSIKSVRKNETLKTMPDPHEFAKDRAIRNNNKHGSDVKVMTDALIYLRGYLIENEITDLDGKKNGIVSEILNNIRGLKQTQRSTVGPWVEEYFKAYVRNLNQES